MSDSNYTSLRVEASGVVLFDEHRERLQHSPLFARFARDAQPGNYTLNLTGHSLQVERFERSRIHDGIPLRTQKSPVVEASGLLRKRASPSVWSQLRVDGFCTLLTDATGQEIFESCTSAVVAVSPSGLVFAPDNRPRVRSTAERYLMKQVAHRQAPIFLSHQWPLVLVNAVALAVVPGKQIEAACEAAQELKRILLASAKRA